jgi:hypothetical protein
MASASLGSRGQDLATVQQTPQAGLQAAGTRVKLEIEALETRVGQRHILMLGLIKGSTAY